MLEKCKIGKKKLLNAFNKWLIFVEMAIYLILLLPLHNTLRLFEYINIFLEVERTFILKLDHVLKKLPLIATYI
jgi:hypothetical protein